MKKKKTLSIVMCVLCIALAHCLLTPPGAYGQDKRIADIKVKGNEAVSTATILSRIKIKPGDVFEESALNKELKRLYAMGYFADVFVETEEREEGIVVTFSLVEKPIIGKIRFEGNARIRSPRLEKKLTVKKGTLLDFNILAQDVSEIKAYYVEQGYSRVDVDYKIEADPDTDEAVVVFVIDEGQPLKIRKITFEGNKSIPGKELGKYMSTKTAWWFIRKGAFDEAAFESDLDRIKSVYRSKGFLDAAVDSKVDYLDDGGSIHITVVVNEGKEYRVGTTEVQGNTVFPAEEVKNILKVKEGDAFDYSKIKEDIDNVRALYYDSGYMNAEIDLQHRYNAAMDKMDLAYKIDAGGEVYVGRINVIGNTKTKDKVIRREMRVYPGEKYNGKQLKLSKERIYNLGFFEDVYFETVPTGDKNVKDLNISVKETKTGEFSFGGGYSSVDAFIGFVQVRQRNFDIMSFPTFTGGGQDLTIRAEAGSARTNYLLSWTDPWIFDYPFLAGFDVYRQETKKFGDAGYDFDEERTGGAIRLGKEITDQLGTGLRYNMEEVDISDISDDASGDLKAEEGSNTLSRLEWSLRYDTRDNKYSPKKGLITGVSVENVGGFIGGDKDFVKLYTYGSYYHPIFREIILELKGRGGIVEAYGDTDKVPIYDRFFAGGANTVRGYEERSVGPRDSVDRNIAVGGEALTVGNAEVVFPVYEKLIKGAVFYDIGRVSEDANDIFDTDEYKQGTGIGVRVKTPIGPVKLDWGYPLNKNHDDKKKGRFYFSVSHGF